MSAISAEDCKPVRFAVLGPMLAHGAGGELRLGAARRRKILAILVARGGNAISAERLVTEVWGDGCDPAAHRNTLYWQINRLRDALGVSEVIGHDGQGYFLRASPSAVDWRRFERLLGQGTAAAQVNDHESASRLLGEALAMWRGAAYEDMDTTGLLHSEALRLEDMRLRATRIHMSAKLHLGHHEEVLEDLSALVARHPYNEIFRSQYMSALNHCGRKYEAIGVYREGRRRLVDDMGLEPGPDLRRQLKVILDGDVDTSAYVDATAVG